jgi:integrase
MMAKARRGNGEGSIYQRANGQWCATYAAGYDSDGKRRRRTIFATTKEEILAELAKKQSEKLAGQLNEPTRLRLGAYLDRWLEDASRPTIRATTYESYKGIVKNHLKPHIGGLLLGKLGPAHVQGLYSEMERGGASARTRQLTHAVLRKAMKQAVRWRLISFNPCDAVDPPRVARSEIHPLDGDQVAALLAAAAGDRIEALYVVAIGGGLRLGELFGLQWADIDFAAGAISVVHTLMEVNGKLTLEDTKTTKSRRRVDLPQVAIDALLAHRKRMLAEGFARVGWVFCNTKGGPMRRSHFHAQHFKPLLARAKLPHIRFHDLRHTSATLLLAAGVHPKVVQERLGHSQIGITLDIYSHVLPSMQVEAAARLNGMMQPKKGKRKAK